MVQMFRIFLHLNPNVVFGPGDRGPSNRDLELSGLGLSDAKHK